MTSRLTVGIAVLLYTLTSGIHLYRSSKHEPQDFGVFYAAAQRVLAGSTSHVYSQLDGEAAFRYSPATLWVFAPMGFFSEPVARFLFLASSILMFLLALRGLVAIWLMVSPKDLHPEGKFAVALVSLLVLRYFLANLREYQVNTWTLALTTLGVLSWLRSKRFAAIALFCGAAAFKVAPVIRLLPILVAGGLPVIPRLVGGALVPFVVGFLALSAFDFDTGYLDLWVNWVSHVLTHVDTYKSPTHYGQSWPSVLLRVGDAANPSLYWALCIFGGAGFLALAATAWRRVGLHTPLQQLGAFSLAACLPGIVMPDQFPYTAVRLALPLLFLIRIAAIDRRFWIPLGLFFVQLSLPGRDVVGDFVYETYRIWNGPFVARVIFFGAVAMAYLSLRRHRERVPSAGLAVPRFSSNPNP